LQPIIGITCNYKQTENLFFLRDYYTDSICAAGGLPLILPVARTADQCAEYFTVCDGILFSGGGDIDPYLFGQVADKELGEVSPLRDAFELQLARMALASGKPALGICRGCQVLNIAAGGTLVQDIKSEQLHDQKAPRDYPIHDILIKSGSLLSSILQTDRIRVNSFHHQAIDRTGQNLAICALAGDGIIEAVESRTGSFYLGVQWHPECMKDEYSRSLFVALAEKSKHF
jgi:putative glutamine amidotransferase